MDTQPLELTHVHLVNRNILAVCLSDGTTAIFNVQEVVASAPRRFNREDDISDLDLISPQS